MLSKMLPLCTRTCTLAQLTHTHTPSLTQRIYGHHLLREQRRRWFPLRWLQWGEHIWGLTLPPASTNTKHEVLNIAVMINISLPLILL